MNSRLDAIQAAVLNVKLKYLDEWNRTRKTLAKNYNDMFNGSGVITPTVKSDRTHIFHQYTIRVKQRDDLAQYLREKQIPHAIYYPIPLYRQKAFARFADPRQAFPVTEQMTHEVLSLPIHTELTPDMQQYVVDVIKEFFT